MNWVDLLIVAVVAWFTYRAYRNGLIREVVTLGGVIVGVILAGAFYDNLAENLDFLVDDSTWRSLLAFIAIFAGIVVVGQLAGMLLKTTASMLLLGPLDHMGGAAIGFIKGIVLVQVVLIALAVFPAIGTVARGVDDSRMASFFVDTLPSGFGLPSEFDAPLDQLEEWRERIEVLLPGRAG